MNLDLTFFVALFSPHKKGPYQFPIESKISPKNERQIWREIQISDNYPNSSTQVTSRTFVNKPLTKTEPRGGWMMTLVRRHSCNDDATLTGQVVAQCTRFYGVAPTRLRVLQPPTRVKKKKKNLYPHPHTYSFPFASIPLYAPIFYLSPPE